MIDVGLVAQMARADCAFWTAWFEALQDVPGNPYGADVRTFGETTAFLSHGIPLSHYNRVMCLSSKDMHRVDDIVSFYRERFTPSRVDLTPFHTCADLLDRLDAYGFRPTESQTNLFGELSVPSRRSRTKVQVRTVEPSEIQAFATFYETAYYHGLQVPDRVSRFRIECMKARAGRSGWRFLAAHVDGRLAGGGALFVHGDVATLAGGATHQDMRGRGCQKELIEERMEFATELGCRMIVSRCAAGGVSQRNMQKAGLRPAYTKVIWEQQADEFLSSFPAHSPKATAWLRLPPKRPERPVTFA